jgi:hypothetical protein
VLSIPLSGDSTVGLWSVTGQCKARQPNPAADYAERDLHVRPGHATTDAGDPADDFALEPTPNGGRINLGAYGGTAEAEPSLGAAAMGGTDGGLPGPAAGGGGVSGGDGSAGAAPANAGDTVTPAGAVIPSAETTPVAEAPGGEVKLGEGCSVGDWGQPGRDGEAGQLLAGLAVLFLAGRHRRLAPSADWPPALPADRPEHFSGSAQRRAAIAARGSVLLVLGAMPPPPAAPRPTMLRKPTADAPTAATSNRDLGRPR